MDSSNRGAGPDPALAAERARDLLEYSSDSVASELDRARGWLREARFAERAGYWQFEGMAGAVGALANAWGRLTLWSRSNGAEAEVREDLTAIMDRLVEMRGKTILGPTAEDAESLRQVLDRMSQVRERVSARDGSGT